MLGKILAGVVGAKAAKGSGGSGPGGALLGVVSVTMLRRMSLPTLVAVTAGGYALKKWKAKRDVNPDTSSPQSEPAKPANKRTPRKK